MMDVEKLNQLLCQADPMHTGCASEPDMHDEYWSQARDAADLTAQGMPLRQALEQVFEEWFWPGCLASERCQALLADIERQLAAAPG
ncbi:hypothetical protein C6568_11700 [Melaminivora suipulveris]|uniref:Uncharacterized protein n=1 Tax=Melaminivora suipulveris TaxID=2109913 RepID=A0A2R3QDI4_9BURK|nr:hypothetical protein [Melaminivora suipulveris]AVO49841.1 hypothetical protein C6568_11700 [Melaminivora suipulveris]